MSVKKSQTKAKKKSADRAKRKTDTGKGPTKFIGKKKALKGTSQKLPEYTLTSGGIFVPKKSAAPVQASKLRAGFAKAKGEINSIIQDIISTMNDAYVISEIELAASFSADGKFMGFGVGGAATITIRIRPAAG